MKKIKTFESWKNNIIDNSLFSSGKAKYHPKVVGNIIKYKTGTVEPYYFADIEKKGDTFICKIYKRKKNGEEIRLRNKIKKDLRLAHNYVREFLNQKLKKKTKKSKESDIEKVFREEMPMTPPLPTMPPPMLPPKSKTIIRRFS